MIMSTIDSPAAPETTSMEGDRENEVIDITREFRMGGIRIPSYKGEALKLKEWLDTIQKLIFELSNRELVLLAYDAVGGLVSKFIETHREYGDYLGRG